MTVEPPGQLKVRNGIHVYVTQYWNSRYRSARNLSNYMRKKHRIGPGFEFR